MVTKGHRWHGSSSLVCSGFGVPDGVPGLVLGMRQKRLRKPSDECIGTSYHVKCIAPCTLAASCHVRWSGGSSMEPYIFKHSKPRFCKKEKKREKKKIRTCERSKALRNQTKANIFTQAYIPSTINRSVHAGVIPAGHAV